MATSSPLEPRPATRIVLLDDDNQVAIIHETQSNYYKIPGGGINLSQSPDEPDETPEAGAQRETLEETGCHSQIVASLGQITTDLPDWHLRDLSYGFLARVTGDKAQPTFDDWEQTRGFELQWFPSLTTAIQTFETHPVFNPTHAAIQARDLAFLQRAAEALKSQTR